MVEIKSWRQKGISDGFVAMLMYYIAAMFVVPPSLLLFYRMRLILSVIFWAEGGSDLCFPSELFHSILKLLIYFYLTLSLAYLWLLHPFLDYDHNNNHKYDKYKD